MRAAARLRRGSAIAALGALLLAASGLVLGAGGRAARAGPPPDRVLGSVTLDGNNAPAGASISAFQGAAACGSASYDGTRYTLVLNTQGPCTDAGAVIGFRVNGRAAAETLRSPALWGLDLYLNLSVGSPPAGAGQTLQTGAAPLVTIGTPQTPPAAAPAAPAPPDPTDDPPAGPASDANAAPTAPQTAVQQKPASMIAQGPLGPAEQPSPPATPTPTPAPSLSPVPAPTSAPASAPVPTTWTPQSLLADRASWSTDAAPPSQVPAALSDAIAAYAAAHQLSGYAGDCHLASGAVPCSYVFLQPNGNVLVVFAAQPDAPVLVTSFALLNGSWTAAGAVSCSGPDASGNIACTPTV